jgi:hypothetical protein
LLKGPFPPHFEQVFMPIVELDPELAWKAIEGYQNELDPEQKALDAFYRQFRCKRCSGPVQKELVTSHAFSDSGSLVPRSCLRCTQCRCLFDPHTGVILELGNMKETPGGVPLIGQK